MRTTTLLTILCVTSCSAPTPPPAPVSQPVDRELAIRRIDPTKYPEFPDDVAVSGPTWRKYLVKRAQEKKALRDAKINTSADTKVLELRIEQLQAIADSNEWWARNGAYVGVAATVATEAAIALIVWLIVQATRR